MRIVATVVALAVMAGTGMAWGKTDALAYSPDKSTADLVNDSQINGPADAVSDAWSAKGLTAGNIGNNEGGHPGWSQVQDPNVPASARSSHP